MRGKEGEGRDPWSRVAWVALAAWFYVCGAGNAAELESCGLTRSVEVPEDIGTVQTVDFPLGGVGDSVLFVGGQAAVLRSGGQNLTRVDYPALARSRGFLDRLLGRRPKINSYRVTAVPVRGDTFAYLLDYFDQAAALDPEGVLLVEGRSWPKLASHIRWSERAYLEWDGRSVVLVRSYGGDGTLWGFPDIEVAFPESVFGLVKVGDGLQVVSYHRPSVSTVPVGQPFEARIEVRSFANGEMAETIEFEVEEPHRGSSSARFVRGDEVSHYVFLFSGDTEEGSGFARPTYREHQVVRWFELPSSGKAGRSGAFELPPNLVAEDSTSTRVRDVLVRDDHLMVAIHGRSAYQVVVVPNWKDRSGKVEPLSVVLGSGGILELAWNSGTNRVWLNTVRDGLHEIDLRTCFDPTR